MYSLSPYDVLAFLLLAFVLGWMVGRGRKRDNATLLRAYAVLAAYVRLRAIPFFDLDAKRHPVYLAAALLRIQYYKPHDVLKDVAILEEFEKSLLVSQLLASKLSGSAILEREEIDAFNGELMYWDKGEMR